MIAFTCAALLTLLAVVTMAIARQRSLFALVVLFGAYSFLMASLLVLLDAVDVAMTEAAVGAGVSTVFLLATLHLTGSREQPHRRSAVLPLAVSAAVGGALIWGTLELPVFGSADAPIHTHTAPRYLDDAKAHRVAPNVVTAVLADYRSFDTLGETTVILTGGLGVLLLLKGRRKRRGSGDEGGRAP